MRVKIASTRDGGPGRPIEIGEIELDVIDHGNQRATISGPGQHDLIQLLGDGFMGRNFHMVFDGKGLANCRIIRDASPAASTVTYERTFKADD
jgi:hypothetical protein